MVERGASGLQIEPVAGIDRTRPVGRVAVEATPCEPLEAASGVGTRVRDAGLVLLSADAFGAALRLTRLSIDYDAEKKVSIVTEELCKGCGTCVAGCPSGAAHQKNFEDVQIMAEVEGLLARADLQEPALVQR